MKSLNAIYDMSDRRNIYYWKCDRPFAEQELQKSHPPINTDEISVLLKALVNRKLAHGPYTIHLGKGQGNHLTYLATNTNRTVFLRLENGPERDNYMEIETQVMKEVAAIGLPVPTVFEVDVSRNEVPFAYQILEFMDFPDLNSLHKEGNLNLPEVAREIGASMATWQSIQPEGYGPFDVKLFRRAGKLAGFHGSYKDYFYLNWDTHLNFLVRKGFLDQPEAEDIFRSVQQREKYLELSGGCLVHKDLALWNILGLPQRITAFIDWDDAISGDPTDDLSLMACFHSKAVVLAAIEGYTRIKDLPADFFQRFYLHLLRNMIVKAVIRVMAHYFDKSDDFFLIGTGTQGDTLEKITREKIFLALDMLKKYKTEIVL